MSVLTLRGPADIVAAVPYLIGFHPRDSIVVVAVHAGQVVFACRLDVPPRDALAADTAHIAAVVAHHRPSEAAVLGYGTPATVGPALGAVSAALAAHGIDVRPVLRVLDGRWWFHGDSSAGRLCEAAGAVAAAATFAGHVALPDREALVAQVAAVTGEARAAMGRCTEAARRRLEALAGAAIVASAAPGAVASSSAGSAPPATPFPPSPASSTPSPVSSTPSPAGTTSSSAGSAPPPDGATSSSAGSAPPSSGGSTSSPAGCQPPPAGGTVRSPAGAGASSSVGGPASSAGAGSASSPGGALPSPPTHRQGADAGGGRIGVARAAVLRAGRAAVTAALRRAEAGGRLTDDEAAWLGVLLAHVPVRDLAWQAVGQEPWQVPLWTDLTRRVEPRWVPAPACLLAFAAWRTGQGALAAVAVERALAEDPGYSMAVLLDDILRFGLPPSAVDGWPAPVSPG
ncbi:DUF4192 domain-containing protein [Spirilliplanes yamanashiensis]|uniref:DUF4192 domain-containing protein n=1 Tax=Spirilliplanes yamanashiensis TaxID=42233 RepID=A0A8J3Y6Q6_9ACTN|nr:DUF4192 domain-containing protein [Spirilliplanes yamanashiensis]MDP9814885.1 hypothetical protein [Spirilliplanes yamanashiensis]GIJ02539.1 hypothetical protein Sya03_18910 [Spirilliplanes yamanashiensis]